VTEKLSDDMDIGSDSDIFRGLDLEDFKDWEWDADDMLVDDEQVISSEIQLDPEIIEISD
jgi:hypothetical protein